MIETNRRAEFRSFGYAEVQLLKKYEERLAVTRYREGKSLKEVAQCLGLSGDVSSQRHVNYLLGKSLRALRNNKQLLATPLP